MKKAQSQTCAREEVHGATQGIPSWAHRLGPQALGAKRTCLWRSPYGRAGTWPLKEMTSFGFWHLFLIHFWTKKRKYLVQLLISCHTIRQSAAPCREHVERVRLVRHRVFRLLMTVSVRNGEKDALR
jgi:hypothetical protein